MTEPAYRRRWAPFVLEGDTVRLAAEEPGSAVTYTGVAGTRIWALELHVPSGWTRLMRVHLPDAAGPEEACKLLRLDPAVAVRGLRARRVKAARSRAVAATGALPRPCNPRRSPHGA